MVGSGLARTRGRMVRSFLNSSLVDSVPTAWLCGNMWLMQACQGGLLAPGTPLLPHPDTRSAPGGVSQVGSHVPGAALI